MEENMKDTVHDQININNNKWLPKKKKTKGSGLNCVVISCMIS